MLCLRTLNRVSSYRFSREVVPIGGWFDLIGTFVKETGGEERWLGVTFFMLVNKEFKYALALVWGSSVKHNPQKTGTDHMLEDEDVVQIVKNN